MIHVYNGCCRYLYPFNSLYSYNDAFQSISNSASILGGFAFSGLLLDPFSKSDIGSVVEDSEAWRSCEGMFYFFCFSATVVSLLTLVFSNFAALFSTRLALRGGPTSVEDTIARVRGEYHIALWSLVLAVELFILSIPFIGFYKLKWYNGLMGAIICTPSVVIVIYLYKRANTKFHLDDKVRFGSSTLSTSYFDDDGMTLRSSRQRKHREGVYDEEEGVRGGVEMGQVRSTKQGKSGLMHMMETVYK